jgi:hypothetical protein
MAAGKHTGTAFLVHVPVTEDPQEGGLIYAVTAGHIIDLTRAAGDLILRVNKVGGGYEDLKADHERWLVSPSVDAAVARVEYDYEKSLQLEVDPIPFDKLLPDEWTSEQEVGEGDELFFATLFTLVPGRHQNLPIARFGHIALMPQQDDLLQVSFKDDMGCIIFSRTFPGYLAEAYSRGGHSGSPAFLYFPLNRKPVKLTGFSVPGYAGVMGVLGLVAAHYDVELEAEGPTTANSGIAVIVPAQHIIHLLMEEEFVKEREEARQEVEAGRPAATVDASPVDPLDTEFKRFRDLTRKLVSTPKTEIEEKRKESES